MALSRRHECWVVRTLGGRDSPKLLSKQGKQLKEQGKLISSYMGRVRRMVLAKTSKIPEAKGYEQRTKLQSPQSRLQVATNKFERS